MIKARKPFGSLKSNALLSGFNAGYQHYEVLVIGIFLSRPQVQSVGLKSKAH